MAGRYDGELAKTILWDDLAQLERFFPKEAVVIVHDAGRERAFQD